MKNKYIKSTYILEKIFRVILKSSSLDIEAEKTSVLVGISRPIINMFYKLFRERIMDFVRQKVHLKMDK